MLTSATFSSRFGKGRVHLRGPQPRFEVVIALLLAGAVLTVLSQRIGPPYPARVALAGAVLVLVPGTPTIIGIDRAR